MQADYDTFLSLGTKEDKISKSLDVHAIFKNYGRGVATCRDDWAYDFDKDALVAKMQRHTDNYNAEVDRWKGRPDKGVRVDDFVTYDDAGIKWSETLKQNLIRGVHGGKSDGAIRHALYRPFCHRWLYFDRLMNERVYQMPDIFPKADTENLTISISDVGSEKPFMVLASNLISDLHLVGAGASAQCFPLYTYALDGKIRKDNITDWALGQFREKYGPDVTKRDIFHYVYGLLHSPHYRERYKENLKRELPRIPLVGPPAPNSGGAGEAFRAFVEAGEKLAALHVVYEQAEEYDLTALVNKDVPFSWRVTKMRLNKDRTAVIVNEALTLAGLPPETFDYKLGNRSALEWVIDQYQVSTDKRSGLVSDPNRPDDPEYIARLVRKVVTVSVETVRLVASLPPVGSDEAEPRTGS